MLFLSTFMRRLSGGQQQPLLPRHKQQQQQHMPSAGSSYSLEPLDSQIVIPKPVFDANLSVMASSTAFHNPLLALGRKERQLQKDLQTLLDAQSEGLLAGLSAAHLDDASSNGTKTPSTSVAGERRGKTMPVRQPVKKKVGLHGARRRILHTIQELSLVKGEESQILQAEIKERDEVLRQVEGFGRKRTGLEQEIAGIQSKDEARRIPELRDEARSVELEIHELETKLLQMRARHRHLTAQISELENSVQAKLSSYQASLSIVDAQVRKFLARPPLQETALSPAKSTFIALPPKRRTLEMAKEHWLSERESLVKKRGEVDVEREALEDGMVVWEDVVREVGAFEKRIQDEVQRLPSAREDDDSDTSPDRGMRDLLKDMDPVIAQVESKFKLAETRDWKLLVCCIGAELEALREGRLLLEETLNAVGQDKGGQPPADNGLENEHVESNEGFLRGLSEKHEFQDRTREPSTLLEGFDEDNDDEPDPELLISHQDTD